MLSLTRNGIAMHCASSLVRHLVKRGHVGPRHASKGAQHLRTRGTRITEAAVLAAELNDMLLTLTDEDAVEDLGNRFRVIDGGSSGNDKRVVFSALTGKKRDAGQIERLEIVGCGHLVRDMKPHHVEGRYRRRAL